MLEDPVFQDVFQPLYEKYKKLDRGFDKKVINKDIETLLRKLDSIITAQDRRKPK